MALRRLQDYTKPEDAQAAARLSALAFFPLHCKKSSDNASILNAIATNFNIHCSLIFGSTFKKIKNDPNDSELAKQC